MATAKNGNNNRATVIGNDSDGYDGDGNDNTLSIRGNNTKVRASGGNKNTVTVEGAEDLVSAGCTGYQERRRRYRRPQCTHRHRDEHQRHRDR